MRTDAALKTLSVWMFSTAVVEGQLAGVLTCAWKSGCSYSSKTSDEV